MPPRADCPYWTVTVRDPEAKEPVYVGACRFGVGTDDRCPSDCPFYLPRRALDECAS